MTRAFLPFRRRTRRMAVAAVASAAVVAGVLTATAPGEAAAATTTPTWLIALKQSDEATGAERACTGVALSRTRVLATADCFTGHSQEDSLFLYGASGERISDTNSPVYRTHPRYEAATRKADWAVAVAETPSTFGTAVLASSSDTALYAAGAKAVFHSWTGVQTPDAPRVAHSESVVLRSATDCAALLGRSLPWGTLCTTPAPDTPPVADGDQCYGDAGGALVGGGKLLAVSATSATGCAQGGVRLYTKVADYRAQMTDWSRNVDLWSHVSGSVLAREGEHADLIDVCGIPYPDLGMTADCRVDSGGDYGDTGYVWNTQLGDLRGDGKGDLLAKTSDGRLYRLVEPPSNFKNASRKYLGDWWNKYNRLIATRDLSGDGLPDLLARDGDGYVWLYKGKSDGSLSGRTKVANWKYYSAIAGRGDYSGDGKNDVVARDGNGVLWLYRGNGRGGFEARTQVGSGWGKFNVIVGSGDMDNDGRQDLVVRTTDGAAYLFNADHAGGFYSKKLIAASGWKNYVKIT
ncbi:FG-GAP-like repeat-containing protein [Streptomyces sp. NPDC051940]|uniref:FG-GAP-like repeat-containing protein n=1 Tax=Streptomyces sp. NPDC051940 TaxID=3155675 RepID=UPI00343998E7